MIGSTNARTMNVSGGGMFNFPLTISDSEPTASDALGAGHIWVMRSVQTDAMTTIYVADAPTADMPNGSLIIQVYDTRIIKMDVAETFNVASGGKCPLRFSTKVMDDHRWLACSDGTKTVYLQKPRVYTRYNDTIYVETSYIWTGSAWEVVSKSDSYLYLASGGYFGSMTSTSVGVNIYYRLDKSTFNESSTDLTYISNPYPCDMASPKLTGEYIIYGPANTSNIDGEIDYKIYKRSGDEFSLYQTLNGATFCYSLGYATFNGKFDGVYTYKYCKHIFKFSSDGKYLAVLLPYSIYIPSNTNKVIRVSVFIFENNGSSFVHKQTITVNDNEGNYFLNNSIDFDCSDDMGVIAFTFGKKSNNDNYAYCYIGNPTDGYTRAFRNYGGESTSPVGYAVCNVAVDPAGKFVVLPRLHSSADLAVYSVNILNKTLMYIGVLNNPFKQNADISFKAMSIFDDILFFVYKKPSDGLDHAYYVQYKINIDTKTITKISNDFLYNYDGIQMLQYLGDPQSSQSSTAFIDMSFDNINDIAFISYHQEVNIAQVNRDNNGGITGFTPLARIPKPATYLCHGTAVVVPNL